MTTYARSGVNIEAGHRAVDLIRAAVQSTHGPEVLAGIGAFGGLYAADALQQLRAPVLVASTDGVGTKVRLAAQLGRFSGIGQDIVNHCVNDILVQGARPLFFLDYIASSHLVPEQVAAVVAGIAEACRAAGCALLGGETAEMPGVYGLGEFDVAGTIVGVVERDRVLPRSTLTAGDLIVGLSSTGPHTNGYSLIRHIFAAADWQAVPPGLERPLGEALLAPHRSYHSLLRPILDQDPSPIKALVHITGGGYFDNIPRVLPEGLGAQVRVEAWPVPALFRLIQSEGQVAMEEMYHVFNMGLGLLAIVAPEDVAAFQAQLGEASWVIGELIAGPREVRLV